MTSLIVKTQLLYDTVKSKFPYGSEIKTLDFIHKIWSRHLIQKDHHKILKKFWEASNMEAIDNMIFQKEATDVEAVVSSKTARTLIISHWSIQAMK